MLSQVDIKKGLRSIKLHNNDFNDKIGIFILSQRGSIKNIEISLRNNGNIDEDSIKN